MHIFICSLVKWEWSGLRRNPKTRGNFHIASLQSVFKMLSIPCQTLKKGEIFSSVPVMLDVRLAG